LLVTGGAGFIGSAFVRDRLRADPEISIIVLDKAEHSAVDDQFDNARNDPRLRVVHGDICESETVNSLASDVDAIVNFAIEGDPEGSGKDPQAAVTTNVYGTHVLLEAARKYRHQRYLQISADAVYEWAREGRNREDDRLGPRTPFAASKAAADLLVSSYHTSFDLPALVARGCQTYGPYEQPHGSVASFITNALQGLPLVIHGDGSDQRDYIHVDDHVSAIARVLWKGEPGGVYNIASNDEIRTVDLADTVLRLCGKPPSLKQFVKDKSREAYRYSMDFRRARGLGWEPQVRLPDGLRLTVEWFKKHESWWRRGRDGQGAFAGLGGV
jgi:dTDP-glucose 4,6-dehydratase